MRFNPKSPWVNAVTRKTELHDGLPPAERLCEFIPQNRASQGLYEYIILQGRSPQDAFFTVLKIWARVDDD